MNLNSIFQQTRKPNRMTPNPMDKATIVSIYPRDIHEKKYTLEPGRWHIKGGTYEKPSATVVGPSSWWKDVGEDQPLLEIPTSSIVIAESIIQDYSNGLMGFGDGARPGLFFVPGELTVEKVKADYKNLFELANSRQKNWYQALVKLADILWVRSSGSPLAIDDNMRLAAKELQLSEKPWMKDIQHSQLANCPACGVLRNPQYPICPNCKNVLDPTKAKSLGLQFAS